MEGTIRREALRFEQLAAAGAEQVAIAGEATLPGSMRDAVTVLSVQAQAHLTQVHALMDRVALRGKAGFQVLYTQGDLTRIRAMETTCDFTHELMMPGVTPGMRIVAQAQTMETNGTAASGRMALRAMLSLSADAYAQREVEAVAGIEGGASLCTKTQTLTIGTGRVIGEERTVVREEIDLPERLNTDGVLTASGCARVTDITGGGGRIGVSGVIEVRVLHKAKQAGDAPVTTMHEVPFDMTMAGQLEDGEKLGAMAQVIDVMADSVAGEKRRTMRVEAEVLARLEQGSAQTVELLEDLYSTQGPVIEPKTQAVEMHTCAVPCDVRESVRIQATLPSGAPPLETALAAFARPILAAVQPGGRRLGAEGVMEVTLVYLPVDSDIPVSATMREPFAMTFPVETEGEVQAALYAVECAAGPATSDRIELRCVVGMRARARRAQQVRLVTDVTERPEEKRESGFVLVWPAPGETRWDTARRLRVPQESLRPAGGSALLAMRK